MTLRQSGAGDGSAVGRLARAAARLPIGWRQLTQEFAKFGTIGVINLFVNFGVFNLLFLTVLRGGELKAKAVAAIVATTCSYFMNRHWTYRDRPKSTLRREYTLFFFFNLVGMVIEVGVVGVTKYGLHQTSIIALNVSTAVGIGLGTLFRFWAYRTHVFKPEVLTEPVLPVPAPHAEAIATQRFAPTTSAPLDGLALSDELAEIELNGIVRLAPPIRANT